MCVGRWFCQERATGPEVHNSAGRDFNAYLLQRTRKSQHDLGSLYVILVCRDPDEAMRIVWMNHVPIRYGPLSYFIFMPITDRESYRPLDTASCAGEITFS